VLVLHERFADLPPSDFAAHLASVSPATRILLMTTSATAKVAELGGRHDQRIGDGGRPPRGDSLAAGASPAGVAGVVDTPVPGAGGAVAGQARREVRAPVGRAPWSSPFSGKGGTGTSMVATNLAVILARGAGARAALVDIDLQFGDAAGCSTSSITL